MNEQDYLNEEELYDTCLDGLMAFLGTLPPKTVKMLNVPKYTKMLITAARLKNLLATTNPDGEITIDIIEELGAGIVEAEAEDLTVYDPKLLIELLADVDNFEVYPLTTGNIRIGMAFHSVLNTIG